MKLKEEINSDKKSENKKIKFAQKKNNSKFIKEIKSLIKKMRNNEKS
jgi:inorganic pyrophosphatase/exopolyphosphatase